MRQLYQQKHKIPQKSYYLQKVRKLVKRWCFLLPNLRTRESIGKQRKNRPNGRFEFLAGPLKQFTNKYYPRFIAVWERN